MKRVVIVGASASGIATAEGLRSAGFRGEIVIVGEELHLPYDRPPLSKQLLSGTEEFDFVQLTNYEAVESAELTLHLGKTATCVDTERKIVTIEGAEDLHYDVLVIATGVKPRVLPETAGIGGVITLRGYDDAMELRARMAKSEHIVIVGAGFIGLEVAATARKKGLVVDVIEFAPAPLTGRFPAELADRIEKTHRDNGVSFHFGHVVQTWNTGDEGDIRSVILDDGTELRADVALVGIGTAPATDWLSGSGLTIDNGVVCDAVGRAADDIYAVGDVSNWLHSRVGRNLRVEHRLSAGEQAQIVAAHIVGQEELPELDLPFFWTDQYDEKWQLYGYSNPDAELEIVLDEPENNRLVAVTRREGRVEAVIGKNAARQLIPYRRDLRVASPYQAN